VLGLRVWHGKTINPRNTLEAEAKFGILQVALLPFSIVCFCMAVIGSLSELSVGTTGAKQTAIMVIALLVAVVGLIVFLFGACLFFFSRPKRFVPPHLRRH
jgi:hypothetical protein